MKVSGPEVLPDFKAGALLLSQNDDDDDGITQTVSFVMSHRPKADAGVACSRSRGRTVGLSVSVASTFHLYLNLYSSVTNMTPRPLIQSLNFIYILIMFLRIMLGCLGGTQYNKAFV